MKASLKFRDEKSPLLRVKHPLKLGAIPLSPGITLGDSPDLAFHIATFFPAGPSLKLAFRPNDSSPFAVIFKAGLGSWGCATGSPLALTAEVHFASKGRDPLLSLHLKPQFGDFSITNATSFRQSEDGRSIIAFQSTKEGEQSQNPLMNHDKLENSTLPSSLSNGDAKEAVKGGGITQDKERFRSPLVDFHSVVNGSSSPSKVAGLEREWKGWAERKQKGESPKEHDADLDAGFGGGGGMIVHVPDEILQEQIKLEQQKMAKAPLSMYGMRNGIKYFRVLAHNSLPLGNQAYLHTRWGIKPAPDFFQGWDGSLQSLSFSKLPSLVLDKISFERLTHPMEKPKEKPSSFTGAVHLEQGLFAEENKELVQVAALCYSMKRQLHLMYTENQVLRKAMEEMRSQVESRGSIASLNPILIGGDSQIEEKFIPRPSDPGGNSLREHEWRKDQKDGKDTGIDLKGHKADKSSSNGVGEVSKELERAILGTKDSSTAGNKKT